MADKVAELQRQIKHNNDDLQDFLKDLDRWEEQAKKKDEELKKEKAIYRKELPPIRNSSTKKKTKKSKSKESETSASKNGVKKKARICSYDYDSWSKFDVDKACEDIDHDKEVTDSTDDDDDDNDVEQLEVIQEQHRKLKANLEKEKGNNLFKEGKLEAAIEHYTKGIYLDPENPILPANRAMALIKLERFGAAEQDCTASLLLDPTYVKALARRAVAREHLKRYQEALSDYDEILKLEPKHKQATSEKEKLTKLLEKAKTIQQGDLSLKKKRSNKPLRRIPIEEVGSDSEEHSSVITTITETRREAEPCMHNSNTQRTSTKTLNTSKQTEDCQSSTRKPHTYIVPNTSLEFDTEFRRLRNQPDEFYEFLKIIPPKMFPKLLAHSIEEALPRLISIYQQYFLRDGVEYFDGLVHLTMVPRFDMARMFLSSKEKDVISSLFKDQQTKCKGEDSVTSSDRVVMYATKFGVKL